jgi:hypothetical protein
MVADAFHFCDVNAIDSDFVIKLARSHFEQEKLDDVSQGLVAPPKASVSAPDLTALNNVIAGYVPATES